MPHGTEGFVESGFGAVADAFDEILALDGGAAAGVSVYHRGQVVVDAWGGCDERRGRPMRHDAVMRVASCSKGVTATALGMMVDDGLLDPELPVARYWPGFAQAGKDRITVAMVASHQAGLPFPAVGSGLRDVEYFTGARLSGILAAQRPLWEPGTAMAYHAATGGAILDEVCRGAAGVGLAEFVATRIAHPLGLRMWLGLPHPEFDNVVEGVGAVPLATAEAGVGDYARARRAALAEAAVFEPAPGDTAAFERYYTASMPAVGVVTDARSLARMYAAVVGEVDSVRLIEPRTVDVLIHDRTTGLPRLVEVGTAGPDLAFGLGYQLPSSSMPGFGPRTFGHTGAGGRLGLADPDLELGFGFVCSRMREIGAGGDPRWRSLMDAVMTAVGA